MEGSGLGRDGEGYGGNIGESNDKKEASPSKRKLRLSGEGDEAGLAPSHFATAPTAPS
jgi:hypothetical protein